MPSQNALLWKIFADMSIAMQKSCGRTVSLWHLLAKLCHVKILCWSGTFFLFINFTLFVYMVVTPTSNFGAICLLVWVCVPVPIYFLLLIRLVLTYQNQSCHWQVCSSFLHSLFKSLSFSCLFIFNVLLSALNTAKNVLLKDESVIQCI